MTTIPPQDLARLKAILKTATRKAVSEYVETLSTCPPGLASYLVDECWPNTDTVRKAVLSELDARQQQGEANDR